MGEDSSSPTSVDEGRIAERVRVLLDRGLERYGEGDLRGALAEWEHALALDPELDRAREYVDYVRQNFEVLQASFDEAKEVARVAAELDVPFGLEVVGERFDGEEDDYDSMEVELGDPAEDEDAEGAGLESEAPQVSDSVDEGWFLDDYADALPPPPKTAQAPREDLASELDAVPSGMLAIDADSGAVSVPDLGPGEAAEVEIDERAKTEPIADRDEPGLPAEPEEADGALEIEAELPPESGQEEEAASEGDEEFEDDEQTVERSATARAAPAASPIEEEPDVALGDEEEITVPGGEEPPPFSANVSFSHDALAALGPKGEVERATPDETTAERPGIVKRDITLSGLDELDSGMRRDDRVLAHEERPAVPQVTFRSETAERHAWAGSITDGADDIDEEEKTIERGASALTDLDDEMTVERRSDHFATPAVIVDQSLMADELPTVEQPLPAGDDRPRTAAARELDFGDADGDQLTRERPRDMLAAGSVREPPGGEGASVAALTDEVQQHLDDHAPDGESEEDRVRRRVTALVERARDEADANHHAGAVAILALAMAEDPDNAAAQMVIHRHRDMLYDIYSGYMGDMNGVPFVSRPMNELSTDELDNRAVFLLSRIDGTLSFEEVLDVSGMPRLEAYGVLCKMLLQGILEVR